jgi:hypothetical protein
MTDKKDFSNDFIQEIIKAGFPVIAIFDHADASASIYAKSEDDVFVGDAYGDNFVKSDANITPFKLADIDEEGLFRLHHEGVRPGEKYWEESLQGIKDEQEENDYDPDDEDDEE